MREGAQKCHQCVLPRQKSFFIKYMTDTSRGVRRVFHLGLYEASRPGGLRGGAHSVLISLIALNDSTSLLGSPEQLLRDAKDQVTSHTFSVGNVHSICLCTQLSVTTSTV